MLFDLNFYISLSLSHTHTQAATPHFLNPVWDAKKERGGKQRISVPKTMMSTGTLGFLLLFFFVLVASTGANSTTITTEELLDEIFGSPGDSSIFAEEEEEEEEDHCSTDADCSGGRGRCQRPVRPWMPRTCACEEPYSGRNCQTCEARGQKR